MSSLTKENESLSPSPRPDDTGRSQPVALEIPVTVNGARTVDGSDKREPFSESTKTVLVFGNGAVIRLTSSVAVGQLLFLTNEKSKKEVICQVVKSKNYRNVSGYLELEFTEPAVGFWGIRFPSDKSASASQAAAPSAPAAQSSPVKPAEPAKVPAPVAAKPIAPVIPIAPPKHENVVSSTSFSSSSPNASTLSLPRVNDGKAPVASPKPPAPVVPAASATNTSPRASEVHAPPAPKAPASPSDSSMEELRLQTARLQEQLSSMQFAEGAKKASHAPENPTKVVEVAKNDYTHAPVKPAQPPVAPPPQAKSLLESDEEVKIPAWLEPLARNTAAPASTQELIEREKAKLAAAHVSKPEVEDFAADPIPLSVAPAEAVTELPLPSFGGSLLTEESHTSSQHVGAPRGSSKGLVFGGVAAAVVLLAGGGYWYMHQSASAKAAAAVSAPISTTASNGLSSQPQTLAATQPNPAASAPAPSNSSPVASNSAPAANLVNANSRVVVPRSTPPAAAEPQPQTGSKKTSLGQVHLAAPTANRSSASNGSEPAPALESAPAISNEALGSGIVGSSSKQPAAPGMPASPLPVGGDVKTARQLSTVPPVYPALAKSQHVSGDVKIDALIDATGHVTTMKVVSGPTLLHQAAMDALRQWRYQPATLDGKPVPMHLTVTIQFRMQQ